MHLTSQKELLAEIREMKDRYPRLEDHELFVALSMMCLFATETEAISALVGGTNDKGLDAIFIDDPSENVFIVQGKFRKRINASTEHRSDVLTFAETAEIIASDDRFRDYCRKLETAAAGKLEEARLRVIQRGYGLQLFYVTTGKCSASLADEATRRIRGAKINAKLEIVTGEKVLRNLEDYLAGAPPEPLLELEIERGRGITSNGPMHRFDRQAGINSWIVPINVAEISAMFSTAGIRLFARNLRGYVGDTKISQSMAETLNSEPECFWYYNNGVTIVCDHAEHLNQGAGRSCGYRIRR